MKKKVLLVSLLGIIVSLFWVWPLNADQVRAGGVRSEPREEIYIHLTQDFYEALQQKDGTGAVTYSNDPRHEYLRRISIASEFTVKTNLTIIEQQQRIIQLLENLERQERRGK